MQKTIVFDFGGSIVVPEGIDTLFLAKFQEFLRSLLKKEGELRIILVIGGGATARVYQEAYRALCDSSPATTKQGKEQDAKLDTIGIAATKLNASLLHALLGEFCQEPVVEDPSNPGEFTGRVLIGAGWKPGFSTDYDAVLLAEKFGADLLLNLSNISQIYSEDPKKNPEAKPLDSLTWSEYQKMNLQEWSPGANLPFDPVATAHAKSIGLKVVSLNGRNLENLTDFLEGRSFVGTVIESE